MRIVPKRLVTLLGPSIFVVCNIFLFGPFTVYQGNIDEFVVPLTSILSYFVFPALILVSVISVIGLLLPEKLHQRYISILFILGILIWLQGNIFVWKYGLLDGQSFDWTKGQWRGLVDGALWIALLIVSYVFYRKLYKIAVFGSIVLVSLQAALLVFSSFQQPEIWKMRSAESSRVPDEIFEFSSKQNVIHIILDAFQSDIFQEIIEEDPIYYYKALAGFTFFKDTTSSFPTTYMSIPAFLSGQNYKNDIPMPEFVDSVLRGKTITNVMYDEGYEVDFAGAKADIYAKGRHTNSFHTPVPYGLTKHQYEKVNSALIVDMVLFRCAPHFLKKYICNDQSWFIQCLVEQKFKTEGMYFAYKAFLQEVIDNMSATRAKPVYKYFHLMQPHAPFVVNEDGEYAGRILAANRRNAKTQSKYTLNHVIELLNKLKALGTYESSLIILHADHGGHIRIKMMNMDKEMNGSSMSNSELANIVKAAVSLMAIKPPYVKGPLKISSVQAALTDIPATISSILNLNEKFPGRSVFEISSDEMRERKFYYFEFLHKHWQAQFFDRIDEYLVRGPSLDITSWQRGSTYFRPGTLHKIQKIDFGTPDSSRFLRCGWSGNEKHPKEGYTLNWALENSASIFLPLPKSESVLLIANITSIPFSKPQHITVKVDGKEIGAWKLPNRWLLDKYVITIGPDENRPDVSIVEFIFSQHLEEQGKRPLAVLFQSITLSEP